MNKRILIVGPPKSGKIQLLKALAGSLPSNLANLDDHSGLEHPLNIKTKYYDKDIKIWIDEFHINQTKEPGIECWFDTFSSEEAQEILRNLGVIIFTVDPSISVGDLRTYLEQMGKFLKKIERDHCLESVLLVSRGKVTDEKLELIEGEIGFIYENQLGEKSDSDVGLSGIESIREVLKNCIWDLGEDDMREEDGAPMETTDIGGNSKEEMTDVDLNKVDPTVELARLLGGMKTSLLNETDVENYEKFTKKLAAAKEDGDMTHEERQKMSEELADELLRFL